MSNNFVKLNIIEPCWFSEISASELNLVLHMASAASYDREVGGFVVFMNGYQKKKMSKLLKLDNQASVANLLTNLVRNQIVYRVDRGTYLLNPNFISHGDCKSCEKAKEYFPDISVWQESRTTVSLL